MRARPPDTMCAALLRCGGAADCGQHRDSRLHSAHHTATQLTRRALRGLGGTSQAPRLTSKDQWHVSRARAACAARRGRSLLPAAPLRGEKTNSPMGGHKSGVSWDERAQGGRGREEGGAAHLRRHTGVDVMPE